MSAFESSHITARVQKALFKRMLAVNRLVPNSVEEPGVGSADNLKQSLLTGQTFIPRDIVKDKDNNPFEQQILRSVFCKISADVVDNNTGDIMSLSSYITGGPGGIGEALQANRPISYKEPITPDTKNYRGDTGITSVSIAQKSYFMNEITINWTCPDPMDFERRIQPIFLKHGRMIFVEFGFGVNNMEFQQLTRIGTKSVEKLDEEITQINESSPEKYQVFRGQVTKYDFKITDYGGYTGTITVMSKGKNILETPLTPATQQNASSSDTEPNVQDYKNKVREKIEKEKEDSATDEKEGTSQTEKDLQEDFKQTEIGFKATIERLPEVIELYVADTEETSVKVTEDNQEEDDAILPPQQRLNYRYKNGAMYYYYGQDISINPDNNPLLDKAIGNLEDGSANAREIMKNAKIGENGGLFVKIGQAIRRGGNYIAQGGTKFVRGMSKGIKMAGEKLLEAAINDRENKSQHLVTWGWFEDHILNSFFQVEAQVANSENKVLQQIRSVHQPYNYEVEQIFEIDEEGFETFTDEEAETKIDKIDTTDEIGIAKMGVKLAQDRMSINTEVDYLVSNRCANSPSLQSIGLDSVVIPGQNAKFFQEEQISGSQAEPRGQVDLGQAAVAGGTALAVGLGVANPAGLAAAGTYLYVKRKGKIEEQIVRKLYREIDGTFPNFYIDDSKETGYIRNLVFDAKYLQDSFKDITSLKQGLRDFWAKVKTDMFDYNGFQITQDLNHDGRIGISDSKYQNPLETAKDLLSQKQQSKPEDFADERKLQNKMFFLPVYTKNSIVRSFSVGLKLTDKAASMAALGSSTATGDEGSTYHYDVGIKSFSQATLIQSGKKDPETAKESDFYVTKEQEEREQKLKDLIVTELRTLYSGKGDKGAGVEGEFFTEKGKTRKIADDLGIKFSDAEGVPTTIDEITDKIDNENDTGKEDGDDKGASSSTYAIYDRYGRMRKKYKEHLSSLLNKSKGTNPKQEGHYNLNKTIIPIELSMTLDGIGGLRVGNMFKTDYLPELYRKYSYFIITEVSHAVGIGGWTTDITAMMKLDRVKMIDDGLIAKRGGGEKTKKSNEQLQAEAEEKGTSTFVNNEGKNVILENPTDDTIEPKDEVGVEPVDSTEAEVEETKKKENGISIQDGKVLYPGDEGYDKALQDINRDNETRQKQVDPTQPSSYNTR
jgi:hypothetical protein